MSLLAIVFTSVLIGSVLPLIMQRFGMDPAHAGATIQVIMDLLGVCITCVVCSAMLPDKPMTSVTSDMNMKPGGGAEAWA